MASIIDRRYFCIFHTDFYTQISSGYLLILFQNNDTNTWSLYVCLVLQYLWQQNQDIWFSNFFFEPRRIKFLCRNLFSVHKCFDLWKTFFLSYRKTHQQNVLTLLPLTSAHLYTSLSNSKCLPDSVDSLFYPNTNCALQALFVVILPCQMELYFLKVLSPCSSKLRLHTREICMKFRSHNVNSSHYAWKISAGHHS